MGAVGSADPVLAPPLVVFCVVCFLGGFTMCEMQSRTVLDLILSLYQTDSTATGVRYTTGPNQHAPALLLDDGSRHVAVPRSTAIQAVELWESHSDITFLATVRQDLGDSGTILSLTSALHRYFEVESSGRRDEVRFHYTHDQQARVETFPYHLADGRWHRLALTLSGSQVTLSINCSVIYSRVMRDSVDRTFPADHQPLSLFVGQRNGQHALFRGALQDVKIVTQSHGYLLQCPQQDAECPTCAQYEALEKQVQQIHKLYQNISEKLLKAEEKISQLEQCQCLQSCHDNGTVRTEGEVWERDKCSVCRCRNGTVECRNVECPPAECKNPVYRDGECCPVCLTNCYYSGKYYDHGEGLSPRVCVTCTCENGQMVCERLDPEESCPPLNCPASERLQIQGQCCPVCKGTDFCSLGHDCHRNASCVNLATQFACQCHPGFQGDGKHCTDIDECATEGGKLGHHCHSNTVCVNTVGSYQCQCQDGHNRLDAYSCEDFDECSEGSHDCHPDAECINMEGTYRCRCQHGYAGDGFTCAPECHGDCLNGGKCIGPNTCQCRHGYIGPNCELDIDECALGVSSCRGNSVCINEPGWYHCDCLQGFHSIWPDNHYGSLCLDVNECAGEGEGHTCHPSTRCVNKEGGYSCQCGVRDNCLHSCIFQGAEHKNGSHWLSSVDKCMNCTCEQGVASCHRMLCDCTADDVDLECCPRCDASTSCPHQEFSVAMQHGESWLYQCQLCECLHGETDCWPLDCPQLTCQNAVQEPGDCCPRCVESNPCSNPLLLQAGGRELSSQTCMYLGHTYGHGDSWVLEADPCTSCECKAGHICCSYSQGCGSSAQ
ncbi:protein kinase C-binding protein NELL1-like isoform X2 [Babylonia areolata]|uniref:protein kinase C-binding protein NELL1-like isoform X2 n=1 Tax=Babylonia areolata TaxID=304850 RepID=UPI003FD0F17E